MFDEKERDSIFKVEQKDEMVSLKFKPQDIYNLLSILSSSHSIFTESAKILEGSTSETSEIIKRKYVELSVLAESLYYRVSFQYDKDLPKESDIIN